MPTMMKSVFHFAAVALCMVAVHGSAAPEKPNIIFIYADDHF
jgi:hypothetical protein